MFAYLFILGIVTSTVAGEESSCELRIIRALFVNLVTTKNNLKTMIDENKKFVLEEVKQMKLNITQLVDDVANLYGEWSSWSNWTKCPVTCLGGLTRRTRTCDNPLTSTPGRGCVGNNKEVVMCNSIMCPDIDDCAGQPCKNGATCVDGVFKYTCNCTVGFKGEDCTDIDYCADEPCTNGTICVDGVANYSCVCEAGFYGATCETPTYYGTSFVMGFMLNVDANLTLLVTCSENTSVVTVSIPALNISDERHNLTEHTLTLTYPRTNISVTSGKIENEGVFITADKPVTLFSFHSATGSSDGSLVLPEQSLSTRYVISSYHTGHGIEAYLIIATENEINVTIETGSMSKTVMLNRLETYMETGTNVSGTTIMSSAPVYVLSGHICENITSLTVGACDYIEEAMPPVSSLGTVHIVSFMKPRSVFSLSIVAAQNNTTAIIYDIYGNILESLDPIENSLFREYYNFSTISVVSNKPLLVTQYGHGDIGKVEDSSMMVIPDVFHFGRQYDFLVPEDFVDPSTIAVVISNAYPIYGLLLNGQEFNSTEVVSITVPKYGTYNVLYGNVSVGHNRLTHNATTKVSFGAWLFGCNSYEEYAWTLGYT